MARYVYYSFHYADIQRANVVRKSHQVRVVGDEVGSYDHSLWEEAKTKGDDAIQKLIDGGMAGASVTVVLIGSETYQRKWVLYEIAQSHRLEMGMLGIHLNGIRDWSGHTAPEGPNPFSQWVEPRGILGDIPLSNFYPVYDWIDDDGYNNADTWIEQAAIDAGR